MSKQPSAAKLAGLVVVVLALLVGAAFAGYQRSAAAADGAETPSATVVRGTIQSSVPADGRVAVGQWELTFATNGTVEKVLVSEGETVSAGDVLATLNSDKADAQVSQASASVSGARAKLDGLLDLPRSQDVAAKQALVDAAESGVLSAQEAYDLLRAESAESTVSALELQGKRAALASAESQLTVAEANLTVAKTPASAADVASARAALDQAQGGLSAAQSALADTVIKAPGDGVVLTIGVSEGQASSSASASGANQASAIVVAKLGENYLEGSVDESDASAVKVGMPVDILVDALDGRTVSGTVTFVATTALVDPSGLATFSIRAETDEPIDELAAGMAVRMQIITDRVADVLVIPTVTVSRADGKAVVSVIGTDGVLSVTLVELGRTDGKMVEVKSGLDEGQKIALSTKVVEK